jgi:hypothetical protein
LNPQVQDHDRSHQAGDVQQPGQCARAQLRPPVGPRQTSEDAQARVDLAHVLMQRAERQLAGGREAGGCEQAGDLVEHGQHLGQGAAVDVHVDEQGRHVARRQLGGESERDRAATRRSRGTPHATS